jgi:chemotaxis protein histidine kinase CheA/ActR/RegA family two-component response regulator
MSLNFSHQDEIYPLFLAEAQSLLMQVEAMLDHADTAEATARTVESLGQAIARIKSGGAYLNLSAIEMICHRLEESLQRLRMAIAENMPEVSVLLGQTLAALHQLISTQQSAKDDADVLIRLQPIFTRYEEQLNEVFPGEHSAQSVSSSLNPKAANAIVDAAIGRYIERIELQLDDDDGQRQSVQVSETMHRLERFGRFLALPKLISIAQTAIAALQVTPHAVRPIASLAKVCLQQNGSSWLEEDVRSSDVRPSFELTQLAAYSRIDEATTASSGQQLSYFLEDASDWLETIETTLLNLQAGDRSLNNIHLLMRTTHTLKGSAGGAGLAAIQRIAHDLETIFQALYKPSVRIDPELTELLFQAYGCLRLPISAQMTQTPINESEILQNFDEILEQLEAKLGEALTHPAQIPTSRDLGVDVVDPIFRTEVAQRLQNLAALVQSEAEDKATRFRAQIEILRDIAEPFGLQGFSDIARMTLLTLERYPEQLQSIAQMALRDFRNSLALILDGDRTTGGAVSNELRQLALPLMPRLQPQNGESREGRFPSSENAIEILPGTFSQPSPPASVPVKTIRIDISRLEHLNRLTGELLNSQLQQGSTNERLQDTLQNLGSRFQQHQQLLRQIYAMAARFLTPSESAISAIERFSSESDRSDNLTIEHDEQLNELLQSALEESMQLADMAGKATRFQQQSSQTLKQQQQLLVDVRNDLTGARIIPLGNILRRLQRVFRQAMTTHRKSAMLKLSGTQVLIDKAIAEQLYDPLLHLLHNALDHGVEPEALRRQLGKSEIAQIYIHADKQNDRISIEVGDDGAGLDYEKIREQAIGSGILSSEQARYASEQTLAELLFNPGFTTASRARALSGRGVGLDVVLSHMQALGGTVTIQSQPQRGTVVRLSVPRDQTIDKVGIADVTPTMALTDSEIQGEDSTIGARQQTAALPDSTDLLSLDDLFSNLDLSVRTPTQESVFPNALPFPTSSRQRATPSITPSIPYRERSRSQPSVSLPTPIFSPTTDTERPGNFAYSEAVTERVLDLSLLFAWRFGTVAFTLPFDRIEEHIAPQDRPVIYDLQQRFLQWNGGRISLYSLSDLLEPKDILSVQTANAMEDQTPLTLAVRVGQRIIAIESTIHHLITTRKLTIQSLSADIRPPSYIYGSALLADHFSVVLVDVAELLDRTFGNAGSAFMESRRSTGSAPSYPISTPSIKVPSRTILIVDDSRMIREVLKDTLTRANYRVLEAVDGQDALDKVRQRHPEIGLVVCDVAMPRMNGFDFLRGFRQLSALANVPVVMLSTCGSDVHRQLASRLGASAYWTKPYDEQQLLAAIKHLLLQSSMLS